MRLCLTTRASFAIAVASASLCTSCRSTHDYDMINLPNATDIESVEVTVSSRDGLALPAGRYDLGRDDWVDSMKYMQPQRKYAGKLDDDIYPIICTIVVACKDGTKKEFGIRWMGKNPLLISGDGLNWYWGTQMPEASDTALGFVSFVKERGKKQIGKETKP